MTWEIGLSAAVAIVGGLLAFRAMRRAIARWRRMRGQPLITATEEQLRTSAGSWPSAGDRWPKPGSIKGAELMWAYANASRARARLWDLIADAGILFGSAWLGVQLVSAWPVVVDYFDRSSSLVDGGDPFVLWPGLLNLFVALSSAIVLILAMTIKNSARDFHDMANAHESAAPTPSSEAESVDAEP